MLAAVLHAALVQSDICIGLLPAICKRDIEFCCHNKSSTASREKRGAVLLLHIGH